MTETIQVDAPRSKYFYKLKLDLSTPGGNAHAVMGDVQSAIEQLGNSERDVSYGGGRTTKEGKDYVIECMKKESYEDLLSFSAEFVELEDVSEMYEFEYS